MKVNIALFHSHKEIFLLFLNHRNLGNLKRLKKRTTNPVWVVAGRQKAKTMGFRILTQICELFYCDCDYDHDTERKKTYLGS